MGQVNTDARPCGPTYMVSWISADSGPTNEGWKSASGAQKLRNRVIQMVHLQVAKLVILTTCPQW